MAADRKYISLSVISSHVGYVAKFSSLVVASAYIALGSYSIILSDRSGSFFLTSVDTVLIFYSFSRPNEDVRRKPLYAALILIKII